MGTRKKAFFVVLTVVALTLAVVVTAFAAVSNLSGSASVPDWSNAADFPVRWSLTGKNSGSSDATATIYIVSKLHTSTAWTFLTSKTVTIPAGATLTQSGKVSVGHSYADGDKVDISYYVTTAGNVSVSDTVIQNLLLKDTTTVDLVTPAGYFGLPPLKDGEFACNTFERFAVVTDSGTIHSGIDMILFQVNGLNQDVKLLNGQQRALSVSPYTVGAFDTSLNLSLTVSDRAANSDSVIGFNNSLTSQSRSACMNFSDVAGHPDEIYIRYLGSAGIFEGYSGAGGPFGPDNTINRAEFATILVKAEGIVPAALPTSPPNSDCDFSDVKSDDWFAGWVWQACADGLVAGYKDKTFRPDNPVLRAEAVTMLYNAAMSTSVTTGFFPGSVLKQVSRELLGTPSYLDVPAWAYYAVPVAVLYNAGIIDEPNGTSFRPGDYATRGEIAKWLYRALAEYYGF